MTRILALVTALAAIPMIVPGPESTPSAGPGALIEMHERIFKALDTVDPEALYADLLPDRDFLLFVPGPQGPERHQGRDAAWEWFKQRLEETKAAGGKWSTQMTWKNADCHSPELGYAVIEFTRSHEKDGAVTRTSWRSTALGRYVDGKFRLLHWHVSPAAEATVPPPAVKKAG